MAQGSEAGVERSDGTNASRRGLASVGLALADATMLAPRWGLGWFALLLGIVLAVMMVCYVAVPARIVGMQTAKPAGTGTFASARQAPAGPPCSQAERDDDERLSGDSGLR